MKSTHKITVFEVVLVAVLSVVIGVAFWGWTFVYEIFSPLLKPIGMKYLFAGFWLFTGIFLPFIVRKPGVAVIASVISSLIEGLSLDGVCQRYSGVLSRDWQLKLYF